ncbi:MAG: two-component system response regulator LytT [Saprospiraceae bacterium]|jgi:two-component system response regulator LytT
MKALIIEDEAPAARKLRNLLKEIDPEIIVVDVLESVEEGTLYLQEQDHPDVIFCDIQLADGISFLIFEKVLPRCPVIFITAFDQYAVRAFEVNSIDYLLKPFSKEQLEKSIEKLDNWMLKSDAGIKELVNDFIPKKPKQRFLISKGDSLIPINSNDIAYIYTEDKAVMIMTLSGQSYFINYSLDEVEQQLDENQFFRLNRQVVSSLNSIEKISNYFNGKLKIELKPSFGGEILVSRVKAPVFKNWLER